MITIKGWRIIKWEGNSNHNEYLWAIGLCGIHRIRDVTQSKVKRFNFIHELFIVSHASGFSSQIFWIKKIQNFIDFFLLNFIKYLLSASCGYIFQKFVHFFCSFKIRKKWGFIKKLSHLWYPMLLIITLGCSTESNFFLIWMRFTTLGEVHTLISAANVIKTLHLFLYWVGTRCRPN